jgi:hypothetical protein
LELFIVIMIIGVFLALTLLAIQAAREAARRTQCNNNLKNIALGHQNYHDTYKMFPMGAMHSGVPVDGDPTPDALLGPSWYYGILPFMESRPDYDFIQRTRRANYPVRLEFCAADMKKAVPNLHQLVPDYMRCPSSPLPVTETPNGPIALPSYVGIAGACDIDPDSHDYATTPSDIARIGDEAKRRPYRNAFKGTGLAAGSIVTASGMLPPGEHVTLAMCPDGTSNTMIVAEQSDWLLDRDARSGAKYHGDAGWTVGGTGRGGGWLSGTARVGPVPRVTTPGGAPSPWGADCWNITTVRYPPNLKRVIGSPSLPGCSENHGINNPLQSPHPGGLLVGMTDGSVQFVSSTTDLQIVLRLAVRLDGGRLKPFDERGHDIDIPLGDEGEVPNKGMNASRNRPVGSLRSFTQTPGRVIPNVPPDTCADDATCCLPHLLSDAAGCCPVLYHPMLPIPDAASSFRWIVQYHGRIHRFVRDPLSIFCADRRLPGAAGDV